MSRDNARLETLLLGSTFPPPAAKDSFAAPRTRPGDREKEDDGLSLGRGSYELIRAFYQRLDSTEPVEALREAQIETLRTFPHPFSWAAFGLTGVPR